MDNKLAIILNKHKAICFQVKNNKLFQMMIHSIIHTTSANFQKKDKKLIAKEFNRRIDKFNKILKLNNNCLISKMILINQMILMKIMENYGKLKQIKLSKIFLKTKINKLAKNLRLKLDFLNKSMKAFKMIKIIFKVIHLKPRFHCLLQVNKYRSKIIFIFRMMTIRVTPKTTMTLLKWPIFKL